MSSCSVFTAHSWHQISRLKGVARGNPYNRQHKTFAHARPLQSRSLLQSSITKMQLSFLILSLLPSLIEAATLRPYKRFGNGTSLAETPKNETTTTVIVAASFSPLSAVLAVAVAPAASLPDPSGTPAAAVGTGGSTTTTTIQVYVTLSSSTSSPSTTTNAIQPQVFTVAGSPSAIPNLFAADVAVVAASAATSSSPPSVLAYTSSSLAKPTSSSPSVSISTLYVPTTVYVTAPCSWQSLFSPAPSPFVANKAANIPDAGQNSYQSLVTITRTSGVVATAISTQIVTASSAPATITVTSTRTSFSTATVVQTTYVQSSPSAAANGSSLSGATFLSSNQTVNATSRILSSGLSLNATFDALNGARVLVQV